MQKSRDLIGYTPQYNNNTVQYISFSGPCRIDELCQINTGMTLQMDRLVAQWRCDGDMDQYPRPGNVCVLYLTQVPYEESYSKPKCGDATVATGLPWC